MINNEEKTFEVLQSDFLAVNEDLNKCQIHLMERLQDEKVSKAQEALLQQEAHRVANQELYLKKNLELIRQEIEQKIEAVIREVNLACQKRNTSPDADELRHKRGEENKNRRKEFYRLKGEVEALKLFREYQDVILYELTESIQKKNQKIFK